MPSVSKKQRRAMAIAEHEPDKLYNRNKGLLKMSKGQLHDFSITKEKNLPLKKKKGKKKPYESEHKEVKRFRTHQKRRGL